MISFRKPPKLRNYLSRREQGRMFLLVMSLGVAVIMMFEARKPENWRWLEALDSSAQQSSDSSGQSSDGAPATNSAKMSESPQPIKTSQNNGGTLFAPKPRAGDTSSRYFPGVKPTYLKSIQDNTTFRPEETDAWFHLFAILNNNDEATLRKASTGRATRAQLFEQSDEYRGELVGVGGTVRRAFRLTAAKNDYDVPGYYQVWLQPNDNRSAPIVVYCLHLPQGFPTGMNLDEDAEIVGFYFKRWPYTAVDTIEITPTILARTIEWRKRVPIVKPAPQGPGSMILVVVAAIAFSVFVTTYVYRRTRGNRPVDTAVPTDFEALAREDDDEDDADANENDEPTTDRDDRDE